MPRGQERSLGPWPCYYLINFIPSSQYSSFPKAVLSIRVTIYWSAVTPTAVKNYEAFGASTPAQCSSPRLPRCLPAAGPESVGPVGRGGCAAAGWAGAHGCRALPEFLGAPTSPLQPQGAILGTWLLPAWLPGSRPATALHLGMWVLGHRCEHGCEHWPAATPPPHPEARSRAQEHGLLSRKGAGLVGHVHL